MRNRKSVGSRVHELAHQSVCVPMPWRKLFAFTSHDIARPQSKVGVTFVHRLLLLQDSALWCCAAIYHLKTPQTSHFHALLMIAQREKAAAVYGYKAASSRNESHLGRVDWRYEHWRPAGLGGSRGRDGSAQQASKGARQRIWSV